MLIMLMLSGKGKSGGKMLIIDILLEITLF